MGPTFLYSLRPNKYETFGLRHGILCNVVLWVDEERVKYERWKSRESDISILGNISFLMGQPKKENVAFLMGQREY